MARYSAVNLLDKYFAFAAVLKVYSVSAPVPFTCKPCLHVLLSIRYMNSRRLNCNYFTLARFLRANFRTLSDKQIDHYLVMFMDAGYVTYTGKGRSVLITEAGKAALNDLETLLRSSTFKQTRFDPGQRLPPGPKKGCSKPSQLIRKDSI